MSAALKRYWDWLPNKCVCGKPSEQIHHIIHVNGQRITKDDWLVVKLCAPCHTDGKMSVHQLGGERQFLECWEDDLVAIAVLNRHNWDVKHGG